MAYQTPDDDFMRWDAESVTCIGQNHEGSLCTEGVIGYTYKKYMDWMLECENNVQCWKDSLDCSSSEDILC